MSREQERIRRKLESNPVMECNKIRKRYCPGLFHDFADTKDPRNLSYTEYSNDELLGTMFYKGIAGIESMQMMTYEFNRERVVENLYRFMGTKEKKYLPMQSRSMNISRGWIRKNCRRYSRSRSMDWSAAKFFMMPDTRKSG